VPTSMITRRFVLALLFVAVGACQPALRQSPPTANGQPPTAVGAQPTADIAPDSVARRLLVDVRTLDPTILVEARYATANNFTGAPLPGYEADRILLRREAAAALARAQRRAMAEGFALKAFDGYRPVRATLAMMEWTRRVNREDLVRDGYIAARSRHNLGLALDVTLVDRTTGAELPMGTPYDTFSEAAHTANATGDVARNRAALRRFLEAEGFANYDKEWWHFSFEAPDPLRFDLVVR